MKKIPFLAALIAITTTSCQQTITPKATQVAVVAEPDITDDQAGKKVEGLIIDLEGSAPKQVIFYQSSMPQNVRKELLKKAGWTRGELVCYEIVRWEKTVNGKLYRLIQNGDLKGTQLSPRWYLMAGNETQAAEIS